MRFYNLNCYFIFFLKLKKLMGDNIEKIFEIAGSNHFYQTFILVITFLLWSSFELISVSLSFLEMMPYVEYSLNNDKIKTRLNYQICEGKNYTIINSSNASWVIEFKEECNELATGLIGTFAFFGVLLGSLIFPIISDKIGRRRSIITACIGYIICLLCFQFAKTIYHLWIFSILLQLFGSIGGLSSYLIMNEIISVKSRSSYGAIVQSSFSVSGIFFILTYYYLDSWRKPFIISGVVCFLTMIFYYNYGIESPRYYLNLNKIKAFFYSLRDIAKLNGNHKDFEKTVIKNYELIFNETCKTIENEEFIKTNSEKNNNEIIIILQNFKASLALQNEHTKNENKKYIAFSLLKFKSQRMNFLIMCYMWFCTSGVYYGLTINIKNLPGNTYLTGIVMFSVEAIAYFMSGFLMNMPCFGRKKTIFMFYSISFSVYLFIIIFNIQNYLLTSLSLFARVCVSGVYTIIYTYSTELYPTVLRSSGLGLNSVCARIGGMIFPLIIEMLQKKISYFYLALNGLALILVLLLPETNGKVLAEVIPEEKIHFDELKQLTKGIKIEINNKVYK